MCVCGRQTDRQRQKESKGNVRVGVEWGVPRICVCVADRQTDRQTDRKRAKGT